MDFEDFAVDRATGPSRGNEVDDEVFGSLTDNLLAAEVISVDEEDNLEAMAIARGNQGS